MKFWPFQQWSLSKKEWDQFKKDIFMALKSVDDVLDQVNTALDANTQILTDLATEEQQILVLVTDLVNNGASAVTDEKLATLQQKVQNQSSALAALKQALDATVAAGQQPVG